MTMKNNCLRVVTFIVLFIPFLYAKELLVSDQPTSEEYGIYSIVVQQVYVWPETKLVVIGHQTTVDMLSLDSWHLFSESLEQRRSRKETGIWSAAGLADMTAAVFADFKTRNAENSSLRSEAILLSVKNVLIDPGTLSAGKNGDYWEHFYKRFPDSPGLIRLSRVGFDRKAKQALVYVGRGCGFLCGDGYLVLLAEHSGTWTIVGKYLCWVS